MVEKTKRALAILRERNTEEYKCGDPDGVNLNGTNYDSFRMKQNMGDEMKKTVNELMVHTMQLTEEKVAFFRKKAGNTPKYTSHLLQYLIWSATISELH